MKEANMDSDNDRGRFCIREVDQPFRPRNFDKNRTQERMTVREILIDHLSNKKDDYTG